MSKRGRRNQARSILEIAESNDVVVGCAFCKYLKIILFPLASCEEQTYIMKIYCAFNESDMIELHECETGIEIFLDEEINEMTRERNVGILRSELFDLLFDAEIIVFSDCPQYEKKGSAIFVYSCYTCPHFGFDSKANLKCYARSTFGQMISAEGTVQNTCPFRRFPHSMLKQVLKKAALLKAAKPGNANDGDGVILCSVCDLTEEEVCKYD